MAIHLKKGRAFHFWSRTRVCWLAVLVWAAAWSSFANDVAFSVASYNVDGYRLTPADGWSTKPLLSRAEVAEVIRRAQPNLLALQEVGSPQALEFLSKNLLELGLEYPFRELLQTESQKIHCAVLSQFPIVANRSDSSAAFALYGRSFHVLRGVMELDVEAPGGYQFTLFNVHLKSKLPAYYADSADYREAEAKVLRQKISRLLQENPNRNILVAGDFNDFPRSKTLRRIQGRGRLRLWDARPTESKNKPTASGDNPKKFAGISWTYYFPGEDAYFRYDYLLISAGMKREWLKDRSVIPWHPQWNLASDHRLILAEFRCQDH